MKTAFRKQLFRSLFLSFVLIITIPLDSAAAEQKQNQGTFHKGWKKRNTPYKSQWPPSSCGQTTKTRTYKRFFKRVNIVPSDLNRPRKNKKTSDAIEEKDYLRDENHSLEKLKEIHAAQMYLLKNKDTLTPEQRQAKIKEIQKAYPFVLDTLSKTKNFPFPSQLWTMNKVIRGIRAEMIKTEFSGKGKTDEQLLKEIQDVQTKRLKKTIDCAVHKREKAGD